MDDITDITNTTENVKERDILLAKLQSLYNAASLASLSAVDHKRLEKVGNEIYTFINDVYAKIGTGENL